MIQKIDVAVNDKVDCEAWGLTPEGTESADPVVTDLPIMVSNGTIDEETPVEWGEAAAEGLGNAFFVTFPYYPHGASTQFKCGPAVATAFMMYPEQQPDVACVDELLGISVHSAGHRIARLVGEKPGNWWRQVRQTLNDKPARYQDKQRFPALHYQRAPGRCGAGDR